MIQTTVQVLSHLKIRTAADYMAWATRQLAGKNARNGTNITFHVERAAILARIDFGRWIVDCVCGAGIATHPDWPAAPCVDCGAVYTNIVYPANRGRIEQLLSARPRQRNRFWYPTDRLEDLIALNVKYGVRER